MFSKKTIYFPSKSWRKKNAIAEFMRNRILYTPKLIEIININCDLFRELGFKLGVYI